MSLLCVSVPAFDFFLLLLAVFSRLTFWWAGKCCLLVEWVLYFACMDVFHFIGNLVSSIVPRLFLLVLVICVHPFRGWQRKIACSFDTQNIEFFCWSKLESDTFLFSSWVLPKTLSAFGAVAITAGLWIHCVVYLASLSISFTFTWSSRLRWQLNTYFSVFASFAPCDYSFHQWQQDVDVYIGIYFSCLFSSLLLDWSLIESCHGVHWSIFWL